MSIPLIDFRGKVTPETDAVLESICSPISLAVVQARSLAFQIHPLDVIRGVIEEWAREKLSIAENLSNVVDESTDDKKAATVVRRMPKRRREVFDASNGMCHYCGCKLDPSGKWHVDHKMPRALMGTNDKSNLVATCVPCNLSKRDRTDVEFIEMRKA